MVHAISGCDSTSSLYGLGKANVMKSIVQSDSASRCAEVLACPDAGHDEVVRAGLQLLNILYGGQPDDSLNRLRYLAYMRITATTTQMLRPEYLPPTENSAKYHVMRVHLQVLQWKSLTTTGFNPQDWGGTYLMAGTSQLPPTLNQHQWSC